MKRSEIREHGRKSRIALRSMRATVIGGSKKTAARSARRLGQFETNRTLFLHVLVRQVTRRIFGGARLALHVLAVHTLARRIFRGAAGRGLPLPGRELRLARLVRQRVALLRHRGGGNCDQRGEREACGKFHGALLSLGPSPTRRYSQGFGNLAALFGGGAFLGAKR